MMIQTRRLVLPVFIALAILVLSLLPRLPDPVITFKAIDKAEHMLAYITLAFFTFLIFNFQKGSRKTFLYLAVTAISCFFYGALLEFLQGFTGRNPDVYDLIANGLGSIIGTGISWLFRSFTA